MNRTIAALALTSVLGACSSSSGSGGNPLVAEGLEGVGECDQPLVDSDTCPTEDTTDGTEEVVVDAERDAFGYQWNESSLPMNEMTYNAATDELYLNNVPFDGDDGLYTRNATVTERIRTGDTDGDGIADQDPTNTTFAVYEAAEGIASPDVEYFAVFRHSPDDYSEAGALGSNRYVSFGYGGAAAQRINGDGSLPNADQSYVFTGEYAGVRTVIVEDDTVIQYVTGTSNIDVDIEDFDNIGAVEGVIVDRRFFDAQGIEIAAMTGALDDDDGNPVVGVGDFISLGTADINFDNWTVTSSTAGIVMREAVSVNSTIGDVTPSTVISEGNWDGVFAGPNGEEISGIVFIEGTGPVGIDVSTGSNIILYDSDIREVGAFTATR